MTDAESECWASAQQWHERYKEAQVEIERLRALVKELADDLEAELNGHYPPEVRVYPSEQRRYERDMANVYEARRVLEPKPCPHWPDCGCGTQSGPHTCEWIARRALEPKP